MTLLVVRRCSEICLAVMSAEQRDAIERSADTDERKSHHNGSDVEANLCSAEVARALDIGGTNVPAPRAGSRWPSSTAGGAPVRPRHALVACAGAAI